MNPAGFQELVKNFTNLTQDELNQVSALTEKYPYCQVLHALQSRAARDLKSANESALLHQSAVHSSDRGVIKWIMTAPRTERMARVESPAQATQAIPEKSVKTTKEQAEPLTPITEIPQKPAQKNKAQAESFKKVIVTSQAVQKLAPVSLTDEALRTDVLMELEKLQKLKHDFEISYEEFQKSDLSHTGSNGMGKISAAPPIVSYLDEIKTTRKKLKVEGQKQIEQSEIIDHFIKTQPSLPKGKVTDANADLAGDSEEFNDNAISETLVNLLLKQGKKDKAIELLRKLIWKFPQKKAYFAAQIEELKD